MNLAREKELLWACSRANIDAARRARIDALAGQPLDWTAVIAAAQLHAVAPLLRQALAGPPAVRAELDRICMRRTAANLLLAAELRELVALLGREGLPVFVHKGLAIAAQAYGDFSLRHAGDLDLFLHRQDIPAAGELLRSRGYEGPAEISDDHYHLTMQHPASHIKVELHWAFTRDRWPFRIPEDVLWGQVASIDTTLGFAIPCLTPEATVLSLCAHGTKETWSRHGLVVDLAELIERFPNLDWTWTLRQADAIERLPAVLLGLTLARMLAGVDLAAAVTAALGRSSTPVDELAARIAAAPLLDPQPEELREEIRALLPASGRERARSWAGRFVKFMQPTAADRDDLRLPAALAPLYYVTRPLRLLSRLIRPPKRRA